MRKLALLLVLGLGASIALAANAEPPKCPDAAKVLSGTDYCALDNRMKNFATIAYCDEEERYRKVCPVEWIDAMWAGTKQATVEPYQRAIDGALEEIAARKRDAVGVDAGMVRRPYASQTDEGLRQQVCNASRAITNELTQQIGSWRVYSKGKYGLTSIAEAERTLKGSSEMMSYCKPIGDAGAGR